VGSVKIRCSNLEEAVRSRPASDKVQKALLSLGITPEAIAEAIHAARGDIANATASLAKSDVLDTDETATRICKTYHTLLSLMNTHQ